MNLVVILFHHSSPVWASVGVFAPALVPCFSVDCALDVIAL
jgi:hypothetical protein